MRRFTPVGTLVPGEVMPTTALATAPPTRVVSAPTPPVLAAAAAAAAAVSLDDLQQKCNLVKELSSSNKMGFAVTEFFRIAYSGTVSDQTAREACYATLLEAMDEYSTPYTVTVDNRDSVREVVDRFMLERSQVPDKKKLAAEESLSRKLLTASIQLRNSRTRSGDKPRFRAAFDNSVDEAYQTWCRQMSVIQGSRVADAEPPTRRRQQDHTLA